METNKSLNKQVNTFLTDTFDPLVTIEPICAILNFENVVNLKFELDTGASDNMISKKNFDLLQASLVKQGRNKSKILPQKVRITLANGALASQVCKVAQINVSRDINNFNDIHSLYFVVLAGPNNLLGRHSLQCLWPKEYEKLKNVCGQNVVSTHRGSMTMKIPNKGRPAKISELNVSSSSLNIRKPVDN